MPDSLGCPTHRTNQLLRNASRGKASSLVRQAIHIGKNAKTCKPCGAFKSTHQEKKKLEPVTAPKGEMHLDFLGKLLCYRNISILVSVGCHGKRLMPKMSNS